MFNAAVVYHSPLWSSHRLSATREAGLLDQMVSDY